LTIAVLPAKRTKATAEPIAASAAAGGRPPQGLRPDTGHPGRRNRRKWLLFVYLRGRFVYLRYASVAVNPLI
jgi:hypothetical protein